MRIQTPQQKYVNEVFGLDDSELLAIRDELHRQSLDFMSISASEARILQFFVRAMGVRKVVEVGMLFGYSALAMAKALPEDGILWSLEKNPVNFEMSQGFFKKFAAGRKVRPLLGDALENLSAIEKDGPFDMVFIDADKGNYANYLTWAEKNVRRGGYIVGDNTFLWGGVWDQPSEELPEKSIVAMKEFNRRLSDPKKYNSTIIPTVEGMTIAQKL